MNPIGKTTIHPVFFYTGKLSGYFTWIAMLLSLFNIHVVEKNTFMYNPWIFLPILLAGLFFTVMSLVNLDSSTRLGLPQENTSFKTNGLYRISRNPMYVGFNLLTLSSVIFFLNLWILIPGIYSMVVYHLIILGEEKFLDDRFGEDYRYYKTQVRRYF